jgi:thymidylate synthase
MKNKVNELLNIREQLKKYKSLEKELTDSIKNEYEKQGITKMDYEDLGIKANYTEQVRTSLDEDKLVDILQDIISHTEDEQLREIIASALIPKMVVDENVLEELVMEGYISTDDILPAYSEKVVKVLKVSRY